MTAPGDLEGRPELGIVVEDAHQHRGIGTLLLRHLLQIASAEGVEELEAHILAENRRMVAFLTHLPNKVGLVTKDAVTSVVFRVDDALKAACGS
jgi:GNAT superfamily N-acetyltransferase